MCANILIRIFNICNIFVYYKNIKTMESIMIVNLPILYNAEILINRCRLVKPFNIFESVPFELNARKLIDFIDVYKKNDSISYKLDEDQNIYKRILPVDQLQKLNDCDKLKISTNYNEKKVFFSGIFNYDFLEYLYNNSSHNKHNYYYPLNQINNIKKINNSNRDIVISNILSNIKNDFFIFDNAIYKKIDHLELNLRNNYSEIELSLSEWKETGYFEKRYNPLNIYLILYDINSFLIKNPKTCIKLIRNDYDSLHINWDYLLKNDVINEDSKDIIIKGLELDLDVKILDLTQEIFDLCKQYILIYNDFKNNFSLDAAILCVEKYQKILDAISHDRYSNLSAKQKFLEIKTLLSLDNTNIQGIKIKEDLNRLNTIDYKREELLSFPNVEIIQNKMNYSLNM